MKRIILVLTAVCGLFFSSFAVAKDYTIGTGDVLSIRIWGEDSLGADVKVRPDGKISLPGVGDIKADGVTPMALQGAIAARLRGIVNEPMVSVMVHMSNNNAVVIYGPGVRSGVMALEGRTTVLELLAKVAPESGADMDNATLSRGDRVLSKGFRKLYLEGKETSDIVLMPGDRIYIPLRENRFVFVMGAVEKPASLPHYDGMTFLEAVNMAGGFTKFADRNSSVVVRQDSSGKQNITVRAGDLTEKGDSSQNIRLQGGDYILVRKGWF